MIVTEKVKDSNASPHITQKDVILCRSGIQYYHKSELQGFITEDNKPPVEKELYREYRPANVIVKAKELCKALPVSCEHPFEWITPDNFKELAGGVTDNEVDVVALEGEATGEIGLKSNITFFTRELYDYYTANKEVSLGYTVEKHFVENPEEVGYDIILDRIIEVNHLAITKSGRGGSSVAVIDSIIGGMKPMRTGIWSWLTKGKQTDSKTSFGKDVMSALHHCKGSTEEEQTKELKGVFDSCANLKDCEKKTTMLNVIRDCYDSREKAFENEEALVKTLDSMYQQIVADSNKDFEEAPDAEKEKNSKDEGENKDSEEQKKSKDEDEKKDKDKGENKDSLLTKEEIAKAVKDSMLAELKELVPSLVKETLGIKETKKETITGGQLDSNTTNVITRDYSEFLE